MSQDETKESQADDFGKGTARRYLGGIPEEPVDDETEDYSRAPACRRTGLGFPMPQLEYPKRHGNGTHAKEVCALT